MNSARKSTRLLSAAIAAFAVMSLGYAVAAPSALAAVSPVVDRSPTGVTADALPTVQIDGVVWSQAVVGNVVYAGGSFANARPAGAAPGTNLTPRGNLLAYNLKTGALITTFAPSLNAQVKSVVASPNGSRIYVGGSFTTANGANRYRIAAYSTSTGALISSFAPSLDATVNSITATNSSVYVGGVFSAANGVARSRLAAFSATTGKLLGWNPGADSIVDAILLTPDDSRVIIGGAFQHVAGSPALGLAAVSATSGAPLPYAVNQVVKDYGSVGAILALSTDGNAVYGTGYNYGDPSNFEGVFSVNPDSGSINWLADCHGDTYGVYASGNSVYDVSHEHYCANIGGFPDTTPRSRWFRTTAFTTAATGTVQTNGEVSTGYGNFAGQPSPSLRTWYPNIDQGTYTHQNQGAWAVTGDTAGDYVVEGGEFMHVNGTAQEGLVRFAVPSIAPNLRGPQITNSTINPQLSAPSNSEVDISWLGNWDQDNATLTYKLYRAPFSGGNSIPVDTQSVASQSWALPTLSYHDTTVLPDTTYTYWLKVNDASGNLVRSANVTVTTPS